jgi:hypothetical protein
MARLHWLATVAVRAGLGALAVLGAPVALSAAPAAAAGSATEDARRIYDEATAAFRLGRHLEAAEKYEAAYAIRPDPALLYNAAQAFRMGGNKPRAMELYGNYARLYPGSANAAEARTHVEALKKAIEIEAKQPKPPKPPPVTPLPSKAAPPAAASKSRPAASTPPPATATRPPADSMPAPAVSSEAATPPPEETKESPPPPPAAPPPATGSNAPAVTKPAAVPDEGPLIKQSWFWIYVGAGAVLVGAMLLLTVTGGGETYPDPTYGTARGN